MRKNKYPNLSPELINDLKQLARSKSVKDLTRFEKYTAHILVGPKEVKKARKATGLSQPRFAQVLGLSTKTIRAWEQAWKLPDALASKVIRIILQDPKFVERLRAV